ncbi:MAG: hypothetical protein ACOCP4_02650 [Candidatus Woesearchaeota archaeon]
MEKVTCFKFKKLSKIFNNLCFLEEVPQYFRYDQKKTFDIFQHLFLLVAKEHTNYGYPVFVEYIV